MIPLVRRALILWRAWRARKLFAPQMAAIKAAIERARKHHRPVRHLQRRLEQINHERLRHELGVKS